MLILLTKMTNGAGADTLHDFINIKEEVTQSGATNINCFIAFLYFALLFNYGGRGG